MKTTTKKIKISKNYRAFKDYFNHRGLIKNVSTSVLTREAIDRWYFIGFQKSEKHS